MRNAHIDLYDAVARPVVAIGNDYPPGHLLPAHAHRRGQLLYGATGVMLVGTRDGDWVVPPQRAVWIPPGVAHEVRMQGVSTRSLYIEPQAAPRPALHCEALIVGPLLHQLLLASVDIPARYDENGRDGALMQLLLHEVRLARTMPLFAPIPRDRQLATLCKAFLESPSIRVTPQAWAHRLHKSLRTFTRLFRRQTGMSFGAWRQQACLLAALPRLSSGQSVTQVALDLGYESPNAFSTMFRRRLGRTPMDVIRESSAASNHPAPGGRGRPSARP